MRRVIESFRGTVRDQCGYDDTDLVTIAGKVTEAEGELASSTTKFQAVQWELAALRIIEDGLEREIKLLEPFKAKSETMRVKRETLVDYVEGKQFELKDEYKELGGTIETVRSYLKSVVEEEATKKAMEAATKEQKRSDKVLADLSPSIGALEALKRKPSEMEKLILKCRNALDLVKTEGAVKRSLTTTDARINEIDSQMSIMQGEMGKLEANQETAERLVFKNHVCPICGSKVDRINELFDAKAIKRHLHEHEETVRKLKEEKERLKPESKRLARAIASIQEASSLLVEQGISVEADIDRLEGEKEELATKLKDLPKLKKRQTDAGDKKKEAEMALERLGPKWETIKIAKSYLEDHKIASDKDLGLLIQRSEQLGKILRALPKNMGSLREATELGLLNPLSIDEHSERLLREIGDLNVEASKFDGVLYADKTKELENLRRTTIPGKSGDVGNWKSRREKAEENLNNLKSSLKVIQGVATYVQLLENIRKRVYHRDGVVSSSIRTWALDQISKKASEYARRFGIGVSSITIKESRREMVIECYVARGRVKTTSMSGGEKVSIALVGRTPLQ
jgi:chromosome segregation ATPase